MIIANNTTALINDKLLNDQPHTAAAAKCFNALSTKSLEWPIQVTLINAYGRLMRVAIEDHEPSAKEIFSVTRDVVQFKLTVLNDEMELYINTLPEEKQDDFIVPLSLKINEAHTRVGEAVERFMWASSSDKDPSRLTPVSQSSSEPLDRVISPLQLPSYSSSSNLDDMGNRPPST